VSQGWLLVCFSASQRGQYSPLAGGKRKLRGSELVLGDKGTISFI